MYTLSWITSNYLLFVFCILENDLGVKKLTHRQKQRVARRAKKKEEWKEKRKAIKEKRKQKSTEEHHKVNDMRKSSSSITAHYNLNIFRHCISFYLHS